METQLKGPPEVAAGTSFAVEIMQPGVGSKESVIRPNYGPGNKARLFCHFG